MFKFTLKVSKFQAMKNGDFAPKNYYGKVLKLIAQSLKLTNNFSFIWHSVFKMIILVSFYKFLVADVQLPSLRLANVIFQMWRKRTRREIILTRNLYSKYKKFSLSSRKAKAFQFNIDSKLRYPIAANAQESFIFYLRLLRTEVLGIKLQQFVSQAISFHNQVPR